MAAGVRQWTQFAGYAMPSRRCLFSLPIMGIMLLFWAGSAGAFPKLPVKFQRLLLADGLSQSSILSVYQDSRGFIWMGTQDGLNRYDGRSITAFKSDPDDPLSLSSSTVWCITEDPGGDLWVGTEGGGFDRFHRDTETFTQYRYDPQVPADHRYYDVRANAADSTGKIWMGTANNGLLCFDPATETLKAYTHDPHDAGSLPANNVSALVIDERGYVWAGTEAGVVRLDPGTGYWQGFGTRGKKSQDRTHVLPTGKVLALSLGLQGGIWVGTSSGLALLDQDTGNVLDRPDVRGTGGPKDLSVTALKELTGGLLWVGSSHQGVYQVNLNEGSWRGFQNKPQDVNSLSDNEVYALTQDRTGVVWIGTSNGANRVDSRAKQFYCFSNKPGEPTSLSNDCVWSICEDRRGDVWSVTESGINVLHPELSTMTHIFADAASPLKPSYDSFIKVIEDSAGGIWLGARDGALNRYDPKTKIYTRFPPNPDDPKAIGDDRIFAITCDQGGKVWFGTMSDLECYDPQAGRFTRYKHDPGNPVGIPQGGVRDLFMDGKNRLWMSLWGNGLGYLDLGSGHFGHFIHDDEDRRSLSSNIVLSVICDHRGRVWVGTASGLNLLDPETGHCTRYSMKDGLPNNTIYRIEADDSGYLWLATNFGLARFQPDIDEVRTYVDRDGIQNNEFNMGASHVGRSGMMYFGGIQGFNAFYPDSIRNNPVEPQVVLTDFRIFNKSVPVGPLPDGRTVLEKAASETDHIELSAKDHVISFDFADLHFASPLKNNFAYIMEGFEDQWNEVGNRNYATYTNLPPGNYTFRVKGSNNDGVWNNKGIAVDIHVKPPFYRTAWFIASLILFMVLVIYGLHRYRTRLLDVKNKLLEKRVDERTADLTFANQALQQEINVRKRIEDELREARNNAVAATKAKSEFLANMSHEIRTPMNGVLGMTSILLDSPLSPDQREYADAVYSSANNLLTVINDILDFSKVEAGKLALEHIEFDLIQVLDRLTTTLGYKAQEKGLHFSCEMDLDVPRNLVGDPGRLTQILINLANNAVKFTSEGKVRVRVSCPRIFDGKADLRFAIQDTGVGIPADRQDKVFESFTQVDASVTRKFGGTGLGLAIVRQLVDLMGGKVTIKSTEGAGTTFRVQVFMETNGQYVPPVSGVKALVVHKLPAARDSMRRLLGGLGCQARTVTPADAVEAFVAAEEAGSPISLVMIQDVKPVEEIRGLVQQLRTRAGTAPCDFFLLCNKGFVVTDWDLDNMGLSGFLTVPPLYERLEQILANLSASLSGAEGMGQMSDPTPETADQPATPVKEDGTKPLILLAEDNLINQKVATLLLQKLGYEVDLATNGLEVLAAVEKKDYAAVLLDVQMPEMDGLETAKRIRAENSPAVNPRMPLIALTAHAMAQDRQRSLDAGMDEHLSKPIDSATLKAVLKQFVGHRESAETELAEV